MSCEVIMRREFGLPAKLNTGLWRISLKKRHKLKTQSQKVSPIVDNKTQKRFYTRGSIGVKGYTIG